MTPTREQIEAEKMLAKAVFIGTTSAGKLVSRIATALATARLEGEQVGRNKALDEAAGIAKVQWLKSEHGTIADADALCAVCEDAAEAILALKHKDTADE